MISLPSLAFSPTSHLRIPPSSSSSSSSSRPRRLLLPPRCAAAAPAASTLYDVLGIPSGATGGEIKAAYRRLALACHPDVGAAASAEEFIRVHAAYATLSNPEKRAEYDRGVMAAAALAAAARRSSSQPRPFYSSRPRRMWETDQCW